MKKLTLIIFNVKNQVFYFNFIEDNKTLVRVFPLEDYRKIDPDMKMDTYNLGVICVKEDNGTLLKNEGDVFKYIPVECDCNVVYSKEQKLNLFLTMKMKKLKKYLNNKMWGTFCYEVMKVAITFYKTDSKVSLAHR